MFRACVEVTGSVDSFIVKLSFRKCFVKDGSPFVYTERLTTGGCLTDEIQLTDWNLSLMIK